MDPDAGEAAVFRFDEGLKVYLHRDPVDFRVGIKWAVDSGGAVDAHKLNVIGVVRV